MLAYINVTNITINSHEVQIYDFSVNFNKSSHIQ